MLLRLGSFIKNKCPLEVIRLWEQSELLARAPYSAKSGNIYSHLGWFSIESSDHSAGLKERNHAGVSDLQQWLSSRSVS